MMNPQPDMALSPAGRRWLNALIAGVVGVYGLFFIIFFTQSGPKDGDQFLVFHTLQFWNTAMFGIAKQWTPLMCSGLSMAGEPQVPFMSLSMVLSYMLGPLSGIKLATVIYFVAGWVGAYLYAGLCVKDSAQRALAAALFIGNGFFFCRLGYGHIDFIPFLILPLMLWLLHRSIDWQLHLRAPKKAAQFFCTMLLMGAAFALAIDGSPVAIIHLLFWIGLYALILSIGDRSFSPIALFTAAVGIALLLDAGYLWPMMQSQTAFPRRTPDTFTSIFSFIWFALLPLRGKLLPGNGKGHELSVFIGPVLAYMIWHFRHWLAANVPDSLKRPLIAVSLASIVLGMGSLKLLHVPTWLSPFDMLRPLPGFRSIGITGRYWGFLALPLSLLASMALWRFAAEIRQGRRLHWWLGGALVLQLGFQAQTLAAHWLHSPRYLPVSAGNYFRRGPETIDYVAINGNRLQGEFIAPTRGVANCYDMDDFIHADAGPGENLVRRVLGDWKPLDTAPVVNAKFATWSHITLNVQDAAPAPSVRFAAWRPINHVVADVAAGRPAPLQNTAPSRIQLILRQAFHPLWQASGCQTLRSVRGNLILDCPATRLRSGAVDLQFDDTTSDLAARISTNAWKIWLIAAGLLLLIVLAGVAAERRAGLAAARR
jgi:hypothetical protein